MNKKLPIVLFSGIALCLVSSPWWIAMLYNIPGTDDKATEIVSHIQPGYVPWISQIGWKLSDQVEHVLLALQIAIGLALFFYFFRLLKKYRKKQVHS
jgi:cobalt transport protein